MTEQPRDMKMATLRGAMRQAIGDGRDYTEVVFKAVGAARNMGLTQADLTEIVGQLRDEGLIPDARA